MDTPKIPIQILGQTYSVRIKMGMPVPHVTVKAAVSIILPTEMEGSTAPMTIAIVPDISGSTNSNLPGEGRRKKIWEVERDGAGKIIGMLGDNDQVCVFPFGSDAQELVGLTRTHRQGREEALALLDGMHAGGSTNYAAGLQAAYNVLRLQSGKRIIIFTSDGQNVMGDDPVTLANQIRQDGVIIYVAAVTNDLGTDDEARLKDMAGGQNFTAATTAQQLEKYFQTALRKAQSAAITQARITFDSIGLVEEILRFNLIRKNGGEHFVRGTLKAKAGSENAGATIDLGEIAPGDRFDCIIEFRTKLPKLRDGLDEQQNTFGDLTLVGSVPALGIDNQPLEATEMYQWFAKETSGTINKFVEKLDGLSAGGEAKDAVSNTTDVTKQREILEAAQAKIRRATQIMLDDDEDGSLDKASAALDDLKAKTNQGGEAASKDARRRTIIFEEED